MVDLLCSVVWFGLAYTLLGKIIKRAHLKIIKRAHLKGSLASPTSITWKGTRYHNFQTDFKFQDTLQVFKGRIIKKGRAKRPCLFLFG